jgi:type IV pilus assembly protein PilB
VLDVDAPMRQVLLKDATEASVAAQARSAGMVTLRASAVEKARAGLTTFEEALRVTHSDHASAETCPTCARSVNRDMVACPWCATSLDRGRCRECTRQLDPDWRICPWCRTPATMTPAPAAVSAPAAVVHGGSGVPVQAVPVHAMPVQSLPAQTMPVQAMPAQVSAAPLAYAPAPAMDATGHLGEPPVSGWPAEPPVSSWPATPAAEPPVSGWASHDPGQEAPSSGWQGYSDGVPPQGA